MSVPVPVADSSRKRFLRILFRGIHLNQCGDQTNFPNIYVNKDSFYDFHQFVELSWRYDSINCTDGVFDRFEWIFSIFQARISPNLRPSN